MTSVPAAPSSSAGMQRDGKSWDRTVRLEGVGLRARGLSVHPVCFGCREWPTGLTGWSNRSNRLGGGRTRSRVVVGSLLLELYFITCKGCVLCNLYVYLNLICKTLVYRFVASLYF